jgi:hypothetical protein
VDAKRFDHIARTLSASGTRRGVLHLLAGLSLGRLLASLTGDDESVAKRRKKGKPQANQKGKQRLGADNHKHGGRRRKHRKKRNHHHEPRKPCSPESIAQTCAGKCGSVKNNCRKMVDCGPCDCDPPCGACETCSGDFVCEPCDPCCDDVCCTQANAVCHADSGACCGPDSTAQTCGGQCGDVVNNCGVTVDCGDCTCGGGCPACQVCDAETGDCVPDLQQEGDTCGEAGQVCQSDGDCACDATSCPDCTACAGDGTCQPCAGCCDSGTCVASCPACATCAGGQCETCDSRGQRCCGNGCVSGECCTNVDCSGSTPICDAAHACVACSEHRECGDGFLCLSDGSCQPCTVTCTGTPAECGVALQTALDGGGTIYVCPGNYRGGFTLNTDATVIGAGQEDDAASNTVLDANGAERVVQTESGAGTVILERLRVTGGAVTSNGAGIRHIGTVLRLFDCVVTGNTVTDGAGGGIITGCCGRTLELTRCTVSNNHATGSAGHGGGIFSIGTATLTDCLIEANTADHIGGGIRQSSGPLTLAGSTVVRGNRAEEFPDSAGGGIFIAGTLIIAETCRVTDNRAPAGRGGGIWENGGSAVTLEGADPSPIVVDNCVENCVGDVPKCATTPVSC